MLKVYTIDDDPLQHVITKYLFMKHDEISGYESFVNAAEALDVIANNSDSPADLPDVILLDLNMPVIDGWRFLDVISDQGLKLKKNIHVFIVSSSLNISDKVRSRRYPLVKGFYSKPLTHYIIRKLIEEESR